MESEKERNRRLYPEFAELVDANRGCITAAAIIEDGELISGRMPPDDYKLAWLDADHWRQAVDIVYVPSKMKEANKWLSSNSPMHPLLR